MARHPRLVEPLRQLFGENVYVHQFKLNAKAAFEGDVWQWHQDYGNLAARRRHAGGARHEHRGVPRRG
ncbi:MAG: phytanoyl-CoA dioxygenase family protein [Pseudolabrys sp.]